MLRIVWPHLLRRLETWITRIVTFAAFTDLIRRLF